MSNNTTDRRNITSTLESFDSWAVLAGFGVILVAGIVAGVYDICTLRRQEEWDHFHVYLLAITIVDLISIVLDYPGFVIVSVIHTSEPWPFGAVACFIWQYIDWATSPINVLLTVGLLVEQFQSSRAKKTAQSKKLSHVNICLIFSAIWATSTLICLPALILLGSSAEDLGKSCSINHYDFSYWLIGYFIAGLIVPFLAITFYLIFCLSLIRSQQNGEFRATLSTASSQVEFVQTEKALEGPTEVGTTSRQKRVASTMGVLVLVCYGPWSVCGLLGFWLTALQSHTVLVPLYWPIMTFPILHPLALYVCHCKDRRGN
ncbi:hypothetical protein BV898_09127 [Hypsibius exemplaris]|uniref:G-protein coupled receptors family 1 profile domain-containing protein n=1 Tax=Hypsibius exemplaris TaxID=2072580 RepID=A0A1W0WNI7_HYPEX|nr:hypothetical protein BV898_09127 [Hypsibius exemplaris]